MFDRHCSSSAGPRCYMSPALYCSCNTIYSYYICFFAPFFFFLSPFLFSSLFLDDMSSLSIDVRIIPVQCALTGMHIQINWVLYAADHLILYSE